MADTTITGLPDASTLTGTERVPMDQAGITVDTTAQAIANLATAATVGLGNANNTSDTNKPISTATQTALDGKAAASHTQAASTITGLAAVATSGSASDLAVGTLPAAQLPATAVTAGSYTYGSFTVDAAGRLTAASTGTAPVTTVTGTAPINSTGGTAPAISIAAATTSAAGSMSATDKSKLDGVATGATANSSDATLLARANHTGTQAGSTVTGGYTAAGLTMATARLLGRTTASAGAAEEISIGSGLSLSAGMLSSSSTAGGSTGQIQFNSSGAFVGDVNLTWDATTGLTLAKPFTNSTAAAASTPAQKVTGTWFTGGTATTTKPQVLIEPAGATSTAWSTSGTGLGVNAASGFAGNLLDLQINGSRIASISSSAATFSCGSSVNIDTRVRSSGGFTTTAGGSSGILIIDSGLHLSSNTLVRWSASSTDAYGTGAISVSLGRDADNTLAQRNGTNAQTSRVYNTYTDASNYERLSTTWSSNVCYTKPENAGTGSARIYVPVTGATTVAGLPAAATAGAGARAFVTDASATTFLSTVAGGGANKVPVVSDGTNWLIG